MFIHLIKRYFKIKQKNSKLMKLFVVPPFVMVWIIMYYQITIYHQDRSTCTYKMCRDCLTINLQIVINHSFLIIPSVHSKETKDGQDYWPQIPLGQIISVLEFKR